MNERDDYADPEPPLPTGPLSDLRTLVVAALLVIAAIGSLFAVAVAWSMMFPVKENT